MDNEGGSSGNEKVLRIRRAEASRELRNNRCKPAIPNFETSEKLYNLKMGGGDTVIDLDDMGFGDLDIVHFGFGDLETADLKLRLIYSDGSEYMGNPLSVHSHLLAGKSEYFHALLSDRWMSRASDINVVDFTLHKDSTSDDYIKCIKLLYAPKSHRVRLLSSVSEALATLQAASEWLMAEVSETCIEYLQAFPWCNAEIAQIKALTSYLDIRVSPDLEERLATTRSDYLKTMEAELNRMMGFLYNSRDSKTIDLILNLMNANEAEDCSQDLKDMTKSLILKEAQEILRLETSGESNEVRDWAEKVQSYLQCNSPDIFFDAPAMVEKGKWYSRRNALYIFMFERLVMAKRREQGFHSCVWESDVLRNQTAAFSKKRCKVEAQSKYMDSTLKKVGRREISLSNSEKVELITTYVGWLKSFPDRGQDAVCKRIADGLLRLIVTLPLKSQIGVFHRTEIGMCSQEKAYLTQLYVSWVDSVRLCCNDVHQM